MTAREKAAAAAERGDLAGESYWLSIAETVDLAPPLAPEQTARLRILVAVDSQVSTAA
ncbi:hypothetical protein [Streptomyces fagopyri]|uniref:hypothetical protein n=1 Tax=Streptomyces fagopyri TaxID=2662397 RepID=UPI0012930EE9|nr:hypothetical protein [Streptomyces fagopyri]